METCISIIRIAKIQIRLYCEYNMLSINQGVLSIVSESNNRAHEIIEPYSHKHSLSTCHLFIAIDVDLITMVWITLLGESMCRHSGHVRT